MSTTIRVSRVFFCLLEIPFRSIEWDVVVFWEFLRFEALVISVWMRLWDGSKQ